MLYKTDHTCIHSRDLLVCIIGPSDMKNINETEREGERWVYVCACACVCVCVCVCVQLTILTCSFYDSTV